MDINPSSRKPRSLHHELMIALVVLVVLVSAAVNLFTYFYLEHETEVRFEGKAKEYSSYLLESLEWPLWNIDDELVQKIGSTFLSNPDVSLLSIRDDNQRVIFHYDKKINAEQVKRLITVSHDKQNIGSIEIGLSLGEYQARNRQQLLISIGTTVLFILVLMVLLQWILLRLLERPIKAMIGVSNDIVEGKYQHTKSGSVHVEFLPIITSLKSMSDAVASREANLRLSEERLKLATTAGNVGIWDWDVANNILVWDESMYALYGIRKGDFAGAYDAWTSTLHPDDLEYTEGEIQAALRGKREYAPEFRIVRPDGSVRNIKASSKTFFDPHGKALRMIGTNYDVTVIKQTEMELRKYKDHLEEEVEQRTTDLLLARNAAEAANHAKSLFLANMSHELRTPLNAILGFSSLMRKDAQLRQDQRNNLDIINRSGEHLLTLINDVLEVAKIEAGRMQLNNAAFNFGTMVRDVVDMMEIRAKEKGLRLILDQSSQIPGYINGDEARFRQILINLVGNAVKFTQQGGVTVRLGTRQNAHTHLLIEIEDTGIGIATEDQKRLFQPFVQLGEFNAQKGTGLGLAITQQYVQLMGGTIAVESTPGKGSIFRVELPFKRVDKVDLPKESSSKGEILGLAPNQQECRVLIVEDQLENQLLLSNLMKNIGIPFKVADNGEQALSLFLDWHPHLIWMDRRMPVMDGIEATKRIRALPGGKDVKIVAVTASAFTEQRDEMLKAGMDDFVPKPYRFNEIYECLTRQLGVQYVYAEAQPTEDTGATPLTAQMLSALPPELRSELRDALKSLDTERISTAIGQVASYDPTLQKTLTHLTDNFDYPAILNVL